MSGGLIGVVFGGALLVWGLMGFYQLDEQERAVVLRFGEYHATFTPGLQWNPPLIDEVITVNTTKVRAAGLREVMLTQDENIVEISMSVQYVIANPQDFVLAGARSGSLIAACGSKCPAPCGGGHDDGSGAHRGSCRDRVRCARSTAAVSQRLHHRHTSVQD